MILRKKPLTTEPMSLHNNSKKADANLPKTAFFPKQLV